LFYRETSQGLENMNLVFFIVDVNGLQIIVKTYVFAKTYNVHLYSNAHEDRGANMFGVIDFLLQVHFN